MVYWSKTKEAALLSGICLARCRFRRNGRLVWSIVTKEDFARIHGEDEDVDSVADEMRRIKTVRIAVLFREKPRGMLRVSVCSKGEINVSRLAEEFGGGGHFDYAGCFVPHTRVSIEEFLRRAEKLL